MSMAFRCGVTQVRKRMENIAYFKGLYDTAHREISKRECAELMKRTADEMALVFQGERVVYAWSGGKDSVVLDSLMRMVGNHIGVCVCTQLEYPCVDAFLMGNKPPRTEIVRTTHDLAWLRRNPKMLFPADSRTKSDWLRIVQHSHTDEFAKRVGASMLVFGRRTEDGNVMKSKLYTVEGRARRYNPLKDFTHLQIWGIVRHFELPEYPLYARHASSLVTGTGSWAQEPSWDIVKATDPALYARVRRFFPYVAD